MDCVKDFTTREVKPEEVCDYGSVSAGFLKYSLK